AGEWKEGVLPKEISGSLRNGSTRALDMLCAHTVNRSTFLRMLKTAEKRLRLQGSIWLPATDGPIESAWRWATSFRIINLKRKIISISRVRSCAPARSDRNSWGMRNSNPGRG